MSQSGPGLFEAVIESWRLVIGNVADVARIALIPFVMFMALHRLEDAVTPEEDMAILGWRLLFTILMAVPAAMLLMPWLRGILSAHDLAMTNPSPTSWTGVLMLRWAGLDIMFFAAMAPVMAMDIQAEMADPGEPVSLDGAYILFWAVLIFGAYLIYGRMGLSLPAAAAQSDHSYRRAWAGSGGFGWRIGFAVILCWLSILIPVDVLRSPLELEDPTAATLFVDAVLDALFRTVNELLSAAVFAQFYIAANTRPMHGEW